GDERLRQSLLRDVLGEGEVARVPGQRTHDARRPDTPGRLDGAEWIPAQSWPVRSRHARSLMIHSLSCGNSSMPGTRRTSHLVPGHAGSRLAHSTASSLE